MSQNTVKGSARQAHITPQGISLERGYIYLTPEKWKTLYALSSAKGLSASEYLSTLIPTRKVP